MFASRARRSSVAAARVLFDPETAVSEVPPATKATVDATFRSAYRFTGDDLVVRLGDRRRAIPVPPQARYLNVSSSLDGHTLKVTFGSPA